MRGRDDQHGELSIRVASGTARPVEEVNSGSDQDAFKGCHGLHLSLFKTSRIGFMAKSGA